MHAPVDNPAAMVGPSRFAWWKDWRGKCCAIVAAGPSAKKSGIVELGAAAALPTIVINESYQLCPWADVLYACDSKWWNLRLGVPGFKGTKVGWAEPGHQGYPDVNLIKIQDKLGDQLLVAEPGTVGSGGNSGFQALNLAVQFGALQIVLIGFDMHGRDGEHWHGRHPPPLTNPDNYNYQRWCCALDGTQSLLRHLGVEVINCSESSALSVFPKMSLQAARARWRL